MNYTKGDWRVKQKKPTEANFFDGFSLLVEDERLLIALCDREGWDNHKERLANAYLIAASPDMYEALKKAIIAMASMYRLQEYTEPQIEEELKIFKSALAKAEGK